MSDQPSFNYGRLMQKALRGLMADVLGRVAEEGLPGSHHFYIGIDTTHPGVDMPLFLKERYPEEMTIVLQDWFEDLAVLGDRFQVTLNFNNQPQTLVVPFDAVQTFIDPSVKFGLKFDDYDADDEEFAPERSSADDRDDLAPGDGKSDSEGEREDEPQAPAPSGSADIVSLDKFRKT